MVPTCVTNIRHLIQQPGCEVDSLTTDNQSPLHVAASEGYSAMVEILLDYGAHVNVMDNDGDTPLHIALAKENFLHADVMSQLVDIQCKFLYLTTNKRPLYFIQLFKRSWKLK